MYHFLEVFSLLFLGGVTWELVKRFSISSPTKEVKEEEVNVTSPIPALESIKEGLVQALKDMDLKQADQLVSEYHNTYEVFVKGTKWDTSYLAPSIINQIATLEDYKKQGWVAGHWFLSVKTDVITDDVYKTLYTKAKNGRHQIGFVFKNGVLLFMGVDSPGYSSDRKRIVRLDSNPALSKNVGLGYGVHGYSQFTHINYQFYGVSLEELVQAKKLVVALIDNHDSYQEYDISNLQQALLSSIKV